MEFATFAYHVLYVPQIWDCESHAKRMTIVSGHENNVFQARALPYTDNQKVGLRCHAIRRSNGMPSSG